MTLNMIHIVELVLRRLLIIITIHVLEGQESHRLKLIGLRCALLGESWCHKYYLKCEIIIAI